MHCAGQDQVGSRGEFLRALEVTDILLVYQENKLSIAKSFCNDIHFVRNITAYSKNNAEGTFFYLIFIEELLPRPIPFSLHDPLPQCAVFVEMLLLPSEWDFLWWESKSLPQIPSKRIWIRSGAHSWKACPSDNFSVPHSVWREWGLPYLHPQGPWPTPQRCPEARWFGSHELS